MMIYPLTLFKINVIKRGQAAHVFEKCIGKGNWPRCLFLCMCSFSINYDDSKRSSIMIAPVANYVSSVPASSLKSCSQTEQDHDRWLTQVSGGNITCTFLPKREHRPLLSPSLSRRQLKAPRDRFHGDAQPLWKRRLLFPIQEGGTRLITVPWAQWVRSVFVQTNQWNWCTSQWINRRSCMLLVKGRFQPGYSFTMPSVSCVLCSSQM